MRPATVLVVLALAGPARAEDAPRPPAAAEPSLPAQIRGGMMRRYDRMNEALRQAERVDSLPPGADKAKTLEDPTRPSPEFESSFREMMRGVRRHGRGRRDGKAEAPPPPDNSRKKLKIEVLGVVKGRSPNPASVTLLIENQLCRLNEGGEVSVFASEQKLTVKLEQLKGSEIRLRVSPWDETIILR